MTKEQWKEVEEALKSTYSMVKLKIDEYEVTIALRRITQFKNALVVYANGVVKGEWLMKECEESRRFFRKVTKSYMSQKQKKQLQKLSKTMQKTLIKELNLDKTFTYYLADWNSFNSMKRHFIKENQSIELVEIR